MAAFFAGVTNGGIDDSPAANIQPDNGTTEYAVVFLGGEEAKIAKGKTSRETLANWMVSENSPLFAATVINRVWRHLIGRGMTDSVDDLDKASPAKRRILNQLTKHFVESGFDLRLLIAGICKS